MSSVVLDSSLPDEAVSAGLSVEQKDLLDVAKPSQVLITQAFYEQNRGLPTPLRTFPLRAGVYEFLWTNEQRLDELEAEVAFAPTLIEPPPPAPDAFDETVVVPVIPPAPNLAGSHRIPRPYLSPCLGPYSILTTSRPPDGSRRRRFWP